MGPTKDALNKLPNMWLINIALYAVYHVFSLLLLQPPSESDVKNLRQQRKLWQVHLQPFHSQISDLIKLFLGMPPPYVVLAPQIVLAPILY